MWLRVAPQSPLRENRKIQDLAASAQKIVLLPFYAPSGTIAAVRGIDGCGFYFPSGSKKVTPSLAYIFTDGEIWAINTLFVSFSPNLILLDEAKFTKSLQQCAGFLKDIGIPGPYRWVAGMEGVQDLALYEDNSRRQRGLCMSNVIEAEGTFNIGDDPVKTLEPLFERVFEACGVNRVPFGP